MARINILDDSTINKIAAGEVVDRPASIIKELVENSIDAGSSFITVEIEEGGKDLIKIVDNGCGIDADDINKAFLRHATSKINKVEDLYELNSLGFRGEALASIAAVSKLEMITKTKDSLMGTHIVLHGGKIVSKEPIACNNGTQIFVRDLFYNTPARRKFLKTSKSEQLAITSLINKLVIGNTNVKIKYISNSKVIFETLGDGSLFNLIRLLYGSDVSENLIEVDYESKFFEITGYIANNNIYRSNKNWQHVFVNGRYVKSSNIMNIINESYKGIIPINKYPVYFLNIVMDPASVDVNIHPNKLEVKFDKEKEISTELLDYIRGVLLKSSLVGKYKHGNKYTPTNATYTYGDFTFTAEEQKKSEEEMKSKLFNNTSNKSSINNEEGTTFENKDKIIDDGVSSFKSLSDYMVLEKTDICKTEADKIEVNKTEVDKTYVGKFDMNKSDVGKTEIEKLSDNKNAEDIFNTSKINDLSDKENLLDTSKINNKCVVSDEPIKPLLVDFDDEKFNQDFVNLNYIGILFNTYILFSKGDKMIMMDQHAAHERVRFEMYMKSFRNKEVNIQMLLEPIIMDLSVSDMEQVGKRLDEFKNFGFVIELYGHRSISIRGVPMTFGVPESKRFIYEIIDNLDKLNSVYDTKYDEIAEIACKSSIKANDKISQYEVMALVDKLKVCENPYTCPHGRPIMASMTKYDIEKMFKRKGV